MTKWLKVIGTNQQRFGGEWGAEAPHLLTTATFPDRGRPSVAPGDQLVYHAIGQGMSRCVAIGEVIGPVRREPGLDPGFPWVCEVRLGPKKDLVQDGVPLEELNIGGGRDLRISVRQHSHIRLREDEFTNARRALTSSA
jgi:hypothetical protein